MSVEFGQGLQNKAFLRRLQIRHIQKNVDDRHQRSHSLSMGVSGGLDGFLKKFSCSKCFSF